MNVQYVNDDSQNSLPPHNETRAPCIASQTDHIPQQYTHSSPYPPQTHTTQVAGTPQHPPESRIEHKPNYNTLLGYLPLRIRHPTTLIHAQNQPHLGSGAAARAEQDTIAIDFPPKDVCLLTFGLFSLVKLASATSRVWSAWGESKAPGQGRFTRRV